MSRSGGIRSPSFSKGPPVLHQAEKGAVMDTSDTPMKAADAHLLCTRHCSQHFTSCHVQIHNSPNELSSLTSLTLERSEPRRRTRCLSKQWSSEPEIPRVLQQLSKPKVMLRNVSPGLAHSQHYGFSFVFEIIMMAFVSSSPFLSPNPPKRLSLLSFKFMVFLKYFFNFIFMIII